MEKKATIIVRSSDRISPSDTNTYFHVNPYPRNALIKRIELEYVSLPFSFKNVTATYGRVISFTAVKPGGLTYLIALAIPEYYYTMPQLIAELNSVIAKQLTSFGAPYNISFSISPYNQFLQLNTTDSTVTVTFEPSPTSTPTYIFTLLGLDAQKNSVFNFNGATSMILPYSFTQDLPFRSVIISFDVFPNEVFITNGTSCEFYIDVSNYRPVLSISSTEIVDNKTVTYFPNFMNYQNIDLTGYNPKLTSMIVNIVDENGNSLAEHAEQRDWSFAIKLYYVQSS